MDRYDEYAEEIVGRAWGAAEAYRRFTQQQVDHIVHAIFAAAFEARLELARLAHEETGMGLYEHKVIKNAWSSLLVYDDIRHRPTVGVLTDDPQTGITLDMRKVHEYWFFSYLGIENHFTIAMTKVSP